jgi:hypothetical protein
MGCLPTIALTTVDNIQLSAIRGAVPVRTATFTIIGNLPASDKIDQALRCAQDHIRRRIADLVVASGALVTTKGWELLNIGSLPFLVIASIGILWLARSR